MRWPAVAQVSLILIPLILLAGSLGMKSPAQCDQLDRASEQIECYHIAAITVAHLPNKAGAEGVCQDIWLKFGNANFPKDIQQRAELESNDCFFDIAKILRDPEPCEFISQRIDSGSGLFGQVTNKEMCENEAGRLAALEPENYFQAHPDSLCNLVFILPLVLVGAIFARRQS